MPITRWTPTGIAPAVVGLCLSACVSTAPISPTIRAMGTIDLREQTGWTPDEWTIPGESHAAALAALERWTQRRAIAITRVRDLQNDDGDPLMGRVLVEPTGHLRIEIDRDLSVNSQLYTLLHELAHVYQARDLTKAPEELFAELVAMQVCARLKLPVTAATAAHLKLHTPLAVQWSTALSLHWEIDAVVNLLTHAASGGS